MNKHVLSHLLLKVYSGVIWIVFVLLFQIFYLGSLSGSFNVPLACCADTV